MGCGNGAQGSLPRTRYEVEYRALTSIALCCIPTQLPHRRLQVGKHVTGCSSTAFATLAPPSALRLSWTSSRKRKHCHYTTRFTNKRKHGFQCYIKLQTLHPTSNAASDPWNIRSASQSIAPYCCPLAHLRLLRNLRANRLVRGISAAYNRRGARKESCHTLGMLARDAPVSGKSTLVGLVWCITFS